MTLADKLTGKSNVELKVVTEKPDSNMLEFYIEAHYKNGEEGTAKVLLYGPIVLDGKGHPIVDGADNGKDYAAAAKGLGLDDSIDASLIPILLKSLRRQLEALKKIGIEVQKVGNYSLGEFEQLYS